MTEQRQIAIVTGAGGGIGFEVATRLASRGYDVFAVDLNIGQIKELVSEHLEPVQLDVTDGAAVDAFVERVHIGKGRIDLLVNNAAISQPGAVVCVPMDAAHRQFEVNVFGYMRFVQAVVPIMRAQGGGRIINVSSGIGRVPLPGFGWYGATKHAIEGLSDSLREEVRPFGIDVVIVEPGLIGSAFIERQNALLANVRHPPEYARLTRAVVEGVARMPKTEPSVIGEAIVKAAMAARPPIRLALPPSTRSSPSRPGGSSRSPHLMGRAEADGFAIGMGPTNNSVLAARRPTRRCSYPGYSTFHSTFGSVWPRTSALRATRRRARQLSGRSVNPQGEGALKRKARYRHAIP
jgi:NAD(P)-dependent dehydrogenase (short-subunit alcohol dehydrogenase family)